MGWKTRWFGIEQVTPGRMLVIGVLVGVTVLALIGLYVRFIPAPWFHDGRMAIACLLPGILLTASLYESSARAGLLRVGNGFLQFIGRFLLVIVLLPLFLGMFVWLAAAKTLPWVYTRIFGEPHEIRTVMHTDYSPSRRSCDYRLEGGPMENSFPKYICIGADAYRAHPDQDMEVLLVGKKSSLGFSIIHVRGKK